MSKIKFIFVSKDEMFKFKQERYENSKHRSDIECSYIKNNSTPLPKIYNQELEAGAGFDYVALCHADIDFDMDGLVEQIEGASGKYDIMGLCGCQNFQISQSPLNWYCGSRPFPDKRVGCVTHGELGNQTSYFSQSRPELNDAEVACIDGLCIIFTRKAIDTGLRFDETLGSWNVYDTDISMQAVLKYHMKVGVLVRRELMHYSVGKSILTPEFLENEILLRRKWNWDIPQDSPILKLHPELLKK